MKQGRTGVNVLRRWLIVGIPLALLVAVLAGVNIRSKIMEDPRTVFLYPEHESKWIRFSRPSSLMAWGNASMVNEFRTSVEVTTPLVQPVLHVRAHKQLAVFVDDQHIYSSSRERPWKRPHEISLGSLMSPGTHVLRLTILTENGAAAVLAWCDELGLHTGEDWEARVGFSKGLKLSGQGDKPWTPASWVQTIHPTELSRRFPRTPQTVFAGLPWMLPLFLVVALATIAVNRDWGPASRLRGHMPSAGTLRWGLLGACGVLWINNILKVPLDVGFDINPHVEYIRYVAENWTIPLATDGWQMFQSPLYYMVSSVLVHLFDGRVEEETLMRILRVIPVVCGLAQIEICYRALKLVFPKREDAQRLGLLVCGLMPMNLYISNYVGNETMAGCLSAIVVYKSLQCTQQPTVATSRRWQMTLGLFIGLALLSKVTPVLLAPPVGLALLYALQKEKYNFSRQLWAVLCVLAVATLVAGWYYFRNWILLGEPFVGGWDARRGIVWWQDPGYRTLRDFVSFSEALVQPINASFYGFWDGLYSTLWLDGNLSSISRYDERPPWNYHFLLIAPWLGILPTAAILLGAFRSVWHREQTTRRGLLFATGCLSVYLAAMLYLFLIVMSYSTVKATYMLGIMPCYALLAAAGFELLSRRPFLRAVVYAWMAVFAVAAYLGYFAV